eukprot:g6225.t1
MQGSGSGTSWGRAHRPPAEARGSDGGNRHQYRHHQRRPTNSCAFRDDSCGRYSSTSSSSGRDEREALGKGDVSAARAAAEALALASEPTIEKMVPTPNHLERQRQQQEEEEEQDVMVEGISRPDASLVARGALKSGYLWKMGSNVPKWKRRFFVLKPITMLFYYMSEHDTEPRGCIDLDLFDAVRKVREDDRGMGCDHDLPALSAGVGGSAERKRGGGGGGSPSITTFELYRSGCPDGSGFMLEARGDEDWEQWVESIANGRHGKMRAEMDVMKGANKLLLEEINGLEQQVATFRGYADQRHVTVLALRDERHRSREIAAELATLADTASALSDLISQSVKEDQQHQNQDQLQQQREQQQQGCMAAAEEADAAQQPASPASGSRNSDFDFAQRPPPPPPAAAAAAARDADDHQNQNQELPEQIAGERLSFEAIGTALAEARAELGRKGRALRQETDRRREVEARIRRAEELARAAEKRAETAEAATARANGRVSVLERSVEYLQQQQRALRAELCQARHKTQLVRRDKAVLKREVRDMRGGAGVGERRAGDASSSARSSNRRWSIVRGALTGSSSGVSTADVRAEEEEEEEEAEARWRSIRSRQRGGSIQSCLSKESLTAASDGGETDFADRTNSEASDLEIDSTRFSVLSTHKAGPCSNGISSPFRESVCRTIRKRVGPPGVPPLPPTRHHRTLTAVKRLRSSSDDPAKATQQQLQQPEGIFGGGLDDSSSSGGGGGGGEVGLGTFPVGAGGGSGASSAVAGLGVAGMFLGLRKGMVDKAAQGMGKTLALWPAAGMSSVSSLGSLAAGAMSGATGGSTNDVSPGINNVAEISGGGMGGGLSFQPQTPVGSPRSASASFSTALTDSPVRWDPPSRHGSTTSTDPSSDSAPTPITATGGKDGVAENHLTSAKKPLHSVPASGVATADATAALTVGGGGLPRVSSASSRTALIQLSDLERAEPCGRRIVDGIPPSGGTVTKGGDSDGNNNHSSRRTSIASSMSSSSSSSLSLRAASTSTPAIKQRRLLPLLPPRPDDEYELVFTSRFIGLQFKELPDGTGVYVAGSDGYVGPAPTTGVPGERLCPDNGDILESYNGITARGKAADVVARELALCGRPLRLGFLAARAEVIPEESDEEEEDEVAWADGYGGGGGISGHGGGGGAWGGRAGAGAAGSSCRDDAVAFAAPSHPWAVSS